ncbi:MAG: phosphodiester glycosidase family protein [bacterium]
MRTQTRIVLGLAVLCGFFVSSGWTHPMDAATVAERMKGRIVLDVEHNGEAWYVYPGNYKRYYLGRPTDAFSIMRFLGLGITNENVANIPTNTESIAGDNSLRDRVSGYVLLQVEEHGEAWYVFPRDRKRYALGRPADAYRVMSQLGVGISAANLAAIPLGEALNEPITNDQRLQRYTLVLDRGSFPITVSRLNRSAFRLVTDTADANDCHADCTSQPLAAYAVENDAVYGIHGSYFCPPDYPSCANRINAFLPPFYNSALDRMMNEDALPFHTGPMIVQTSDGGISYFHRTVDFGWTVADYEQRTKKNVVAAAANYPSLVENGTVVVDSEPIEDKQRLKATRGAIGYNSTKWFLVVAQSASVVDMASIMKSLGATYAMNLDGGGSVALLFDGTYAVGPGRRLPNAILFSAR